MHPFYHNKDSWIIITCDLHIANKSIQYTAKLSCSWKVTLFYNLSALAQPCMFLVLDFYSHLHYMCNWCDSLFSMWPVLMFQTGAFFLFKNTSFWTLWTFSMVNNIKHSRCFVKYGSSQKFLHAWWYSPINFFTTFKNLGYWNRKMHQFEVLEQTTN